MLRADGVSQQLVVEEGVLMCHTLGHLSVEQYMHALEACRRGCEGIAKFFKLTLLNSLKVGRSFMSEC